MERNLFRKNVRRPCKSQLGSVRASAQHNVLNYRKEVLLHKTFHRYTVRAKRGTAQGLKDSQNRSHTPKSAGATLRRHNEAALVKAKLQLIFISSITMIVYTVLFTKNKLILLRPSVTLKRLRVSLVPNMFLLRYPSSFWQRSFRSKVNHETCFDATHSEEVLFCCVFYNSTIRWCRFFSKHLYTILQEIQDRSNM